MDFYQNSLCYVFLLENKYQYLPKKSRIIVFIGSGGRTTTVVGFGHGNHLKAKGIEDV